VPADLVRVGVELLGAERRPLAGAEDQVHARRTETLDALDLAVVEVELEDVARLGRPAELGVMDLVGERAQLRRGLDPDQEVGEPHPFAVHEAGVVDHLAAGAHRGLGRRGALGDAARVRDRQHVAPLLHQGVEERLLVAAALDQQLGVRVQLLARVDLPALEQKVEVRAVLAAEEVVEAARGEPPWWARERGHHP
jgi:hypothetical protein